MKRAARPKSTESANDDLRREYRFDYRQSKPNRFAERLSGATIAVVLDPDVASVFRTSDTVNSLLRSVANAVRRKPVTRKLTRRAKRANKRLKLTSGGQSR